MRNLNSGCTIQGLTCSVSFFPFSCVIIPETTSAVKSFLLSGRNPFLNVSQEIASFAVFESPAPKRIVNEITHQLILALPLNFGPQMRTSAPSSTLKVFVIEPKRRFILRRYDTPMLMPISISYAKGFQAIRK